MLQQKNYCTLKFRDDRLADQYSPVRPPSQDKCLQCSSRTSLPDSDRSSTLFKVKLMVLFVGTYHGYKIFTQGYIDSYIFCNILLLSSQKIYKNQHLPAIFQIRK